MFEDGLDLHNFVKMALPGQVGKKRSYTSTRRRLRGEHEHEHQQPQPQTIMRASKSCEIAWLQYLKSGLLLCGNVLGARRHCRSLGRVAPHQEQVSLDNIAGIIAAESRPVVKGNAIIYHIILRFGFAVIDCQSVDNGTNTSVSLTIHFPLQSSLSLHTHTNKQRSSFNIDTCWLASSTYLYSCRDYRTWRTLIN